jgi:hypothetical protein
MSITEDDLFADSLRVLFQAHARLSLTGCRRDMEHFKSSLDDMIDYIDNYVEKRVEQAIKDKTIDYRSPSK